jgi:hypothetical protein
VDKRSSHQALAQAMRTAIALPLKRLDNDAFERHVTRFRQSGIGLVNYISYFNALQSERANRGTQLLPEVRQILKSRTTSAVDDCQTMVESFAEVAGLLHQSGTSLVLEQHLPKVLEADDPSAIHRKFTEYCSSVGLTEHQITKPLKALARNNYNVLAIGNGTIAGVVTEQQKLLSSSKKLEVKIQLKNSGLGVHANDDDGEGGTVDPPYQLNGGGGGDGGDGDGGVGLAWIPIIIAGVIIVTYLGCQAYNAYHSTEPGFTPLNCDGDLPPGAP